MKKDLFIDNNIAKNFSNPQDEEYIKQWKAERKDLAHVRAPESPAAAVPAR